MKIRASVIAGLLASTLWISAVAAQGTPPTPESWFGHRMGTDGFLEPYDKMVAYYRQLEKTSNRVKVVELGKTTEGRPYLAMFISSPENLARLDEYRQMNLKLTDPRGVPQEELDRIVRDGKPIVAQSYDLHSTEIGSSLTAVEFTHNMVTRTDPATMNVLNNVILIVLPSINPDGHEITQKYYMKYKGTPYEGGPIAELYQKYVGHDDNRDAFMMNLPESKNLGKLLYVDWKPEAYIDHHQMGSYGPRIVIPPYADPIRPDADPLVWREEAWYGAEMAAQMDAAKLPGAIGNAIYSGWGHFGFHWITPFHNIAGMLDESASANLASPLYIHPDQIADGTQRNVPDNRPQMNMPDVWPGGWWRARDIVERQLITSWAVVDMAARNRETILRNAYLKAQRQTERGAAAQTKAYVIDAAQHDPLTVVKLVNSLIQQGVDVYKAPAQFVNENHVYPAGAFVVPMNQPNMGLIRYLLGRTFFPDDVYARKKDGTPIKPYDMSTDTQTEFMGVESTPVGNMVPTAGMERLTSVITPRGTVASGGAFLLNGNLNDAFHAVNLLMKQGATVRRVQSASGKAKPGDFVVTGVSAQTAQSLAASTGVDFAPADGVSDSATYTLKAPRVAMLKRYRGGNIDEGWTRMLFDNYDFSYSSIMDAEIKAGNLIKKYDVIVLPSDTLQMMTGEAPARGGGGGTPATGSGNGGSRTTVEGIPPEYRSGFGDDGVKALEEFVSAGGRLVTFGEAGDLPIQKFHLPVRNVVANKPGKEFWSPGSTLHINVDNLNPLAYGMPKQALAIYTLECQVYETTPSMHNERVDVIASYPSRDILRSGWLLGEPVIANKAAAVSVQHGKGDVVMLGFRPQHRDQAHGTYKLVFDALYNAPKAPVTTAGL